MISDALEYIRKELRDYLSIDDSVASVGHLHTLSSKDVNPGLRISLINVGEEPTLRNTSHVKRTQAGLSEYQEPAIYLNCHVMIAFDFESYETNLIRLSKAIELFQSKRFFDYSNQTVINPFPLSLERLVFDMCTVEFEQLNHIWGVAGGSYFPSVLYKVRLLKIQADEQLAGPNITSVQVGTRFKVR